MSALGLKIINDVKAVVGDTVVVPAPVHQTANGAAISLVGTTAVLEIYKSQSADVLLTLPIDTSVSLSAKILPAMSTSLGAGEFRLLTRLTDSSADVTTLQVVCLSLKSPGDLWN